MHGLLVFPLYPDYNKNIKRIERSKGEGETT
jgi:hypothetical protein